ncbi:hypothetical protein Tco_1084106, partial [Tanacetum coccineum]
HKFNEDKLRIMQNEYLEKYFESLEKGDNSDEGTKTIGIEDDLIEIKGAIYPTRVNTFNEYVAFLNLLKQDEIISQQWDVFREKFDKVVKWEFGKIGEILGLSIQDEEEVKRRQRVTCLTSHQCDVAEIKAPSMETTNSKGKAEKIEHFRVKLEDIKKESDGHHFQPIQPNIKGSLTLNKDIQRVIKRPTSSEFADKEDTNNSSSDDLTIIT